MIAGRRRDQYVTAPDHFLGGIGPCIRHEWFDAALAHVERLSVDDLSPERRAELTRFLQGYLNFVRDTRLPGGGFALLYNAKDSLGGPWVEETGIATSPDLETWTRGAANPVVLQQSPSARKSPAGTAAAVARVGSRIGTLPCRSVLTRVVRSSNFGSPPSVRNHGAGSLKTE